MKSGNIVFYKGIKYWVISIWNVGDDESLDIIEIAPTKHGAGSFYVTREYLKTAKAEIV